MKNKPTVSIVGTPIGNLGDISLRAVETIKESDVIFAEDTRTAMNLLNHLGLKKRIVSCHKDNEHVAVAKIIKEADLGNKIALISEAGMPCISDPGAETVRELIKTGMPFEIISGPTALIHGLIASGFSGGPFFFYGFPPHKSSEKRNVFNKLLAVHAPLIFYESPHRVAETIKMMLDIFPAPIACCRELTKLYEETIFINNYEDIEKLTLKGEFVIVVDNSSAAESNNKSNFDAEKICAKLIKEGFSSQETVKILKALGIKRNDAYQISMKYNASEAKHTLYNSIDDNKA